MKDNPDLVCKLADLDTNFGNRATGERIRKLVKNMQADNPNAHIRIVMDGITIISSAFADELFGKLFVELGFVDFTALICIQGANPLCTKIIDSVVCQRLTQQNFS